MQAQHLLATSLSIPYSQYLHLWGGLFFLLVHITDNKSSRAEWNFYTLSKNLVMSKK